MRFVTYNIQYGKGRDGRFDLRRIADAVREADVIALQEVERYWIRSGMVDQAAELAGLLPDHHWVYGPGLDIDASLQDRAGRLVHRRRQFGNMLLSREPILSSRCFPLPKLGTVIQHSLQRVALEGVISRGSGGSAPVRVYSIHLTHLADATRGPQVDAILDIHRRAPAEGGAWCGTHAEAAWTENGPAPPMPRDALLMGDFNLDPSSPLYDRIVGPLSPEYGRMNAIEGFVDAWVAAGHGERDGVTCHGVHAGQRIDYCFVSTPLLPRLRGCWIDDAAAGSDHQPVWTELDL
jgi:endonuclease/exonuclease/phosphatase family metal-dependent hydrolase